jgi:hypothetical protein
MECADVLAVDEVWFIDAGHALFSRRDSGEWGHTSAGFIRRIVAGFSSRALEQAISSAAASRQRFARENLQPNSEVLHTLAAIRSSGRRLGLMSVCGPAVDDVRDSTPLATAFESVMLSVEHAAG